MRKLVSAAVCALALAAMVACFGCSSGASSSSATSGSSSASASAAASASATASSAASASASAAASASASSAAAPSSEPLADGQYTVDVTTDSSMFHVNESKNGTGDLTVSGGKNTVHLTLVSKRIVNLYAGTAEQAKADPDGVIQPTTDKVKYSDGTEEEVYGFDVPVPAIGEEFDVAILGDKGNWYDHKVTISNPQKQ